MVMKNENGDGSENENKDKGTWKIGNMENKRTRENLDSLKP